MKSKNINISDKSLNEPDINVSKSETTPINQDLVNAKISNLSDKSIKSKKPRFNLRIKERWIALPKFKKALIIFAAILLLITPVFGAYLYQTLVRAERITEDIVRLKSSYLPPSKNINVSLLGQIELFEAKEPSKPKTAESPLNGILLSDQELADLKNRAPIAVMINNHIDARPLAGISQADIVYESLVEGGITRHMAIFWSNGVDKVGPIRSVRNYHLEWLLPYGAILLHDGCASSAEEPRVNACGNIYNYGVYDLATYGAWRVNTNGRFAPHNEYTSVTGAWEYDSKDPATLPENFVAWKFKKEATPADRGNQDQINITFDPSGQNGTTYNVSWSYDKDSNIYIRSVGGEIDIDENSGEPITAKTVIIERSITQPTFNDKGHIIIETTGEGTATILQDGKSIEGKWKRANRKERTKYFDASGSEITHNRGLIWIENISSAQGRLDIITR